MFYKHMWHNHKIKGSISLWFSETMICRHLAWQRQFPVKYLHLPSNLVINIFTLTDIVLEFYMHYSVYSKLLAARIFADSCQNLRSHAQLIANKLRATDSNISTDK